jgi:ribosome-associated toxin RatA of RatAB toxin-antitoxin module
LQRVIFELEVMKRFQYELEFNIIPGKEVTWHLVESNFFKKNEGRWGLASLGADRTHVQYEVEVAFGFFVPGWVTKKLTEVNLPKMLDSFEGQAKKVQAKG